MYKWFHKYRGQAEKVVVCICQEKNCARRDSPQMVQLARAENVACRKNSGDSRAPQKRLVGLLHDFFISNSELRGIACH